MRNIVYHLLYDKKLETICQKHPNLLFYNTQQRIKPDYFYRQDKNTHIYSLMLNLRHLKEVDRKKVMESILEIPELKKSESNVKSNNIVEISIGTVQIIYSLLYESLFQFFLHDTSYILEYVWKLGEMGMVFNQTHKKLYYYHYYPVDLIQKLNMLITTMNCQYSPICLAEGDFKLLTTYQLLLVLKSKDVSIQNVINCYRLDCENMLSRSRGVKYTKIFKRYITIQQDQTLPISLLEKDMYTILSYLRDNDAKIASVVKEIASEISQNLRRCICMIPDDVLIDLNKFDTSDVFINYDTVSGIKGILKLFKKMISYQAKQLKIPPHFCNLYRIAQTSGENQQICQKIFPECDYQEEVSLPIQKETEPDEDFDESEDDEDTDYLDSETYR